MSYDQIIGRWIYRTLLIILLICVIGMAVVAIAKAKRATARSDAYIEYLDTKYGWDDLRR